MSPCKALFALLIAMPLLAQQAGSSSPTLEPVRESITITASPLGPDIDLRNGAAFRKTLFTRDDQIFHLLDAGINAGQHEGGGKSLEIRRFGFNLDHGGVNGGLAGHRRQHAAEPLHAGTWSGLSRLAKEPVP